MRYSYTAKRFVQPYFSSRSRAFKNGASVIRANRCRSRFMVDNEATLYGFGRVFSTSTLNKQLESEHHDSYALFGIVFGVGLSAVLMSSKASYSVDCEDSTSSSVSPDEQTESQQTKPRRWLRFWYSSSGPSSRKSGKSESMFTSRELEEGLKRREKREAELQWFRKQVQHRVYLLQQRRQDNEITDQQLQLEMHALKLEVLKQAQKILYGVEEPGARERYLHKYGCVAWNDEALKEISRHGKLIEIGAGGGQWQNELHTNWNVDIVAFDNGDQIPLPNEAPVGKVRRGDEQVIAHYPERTLMLVYPPPGEMALNCLKYYKGDTIIYVGEGKGGCNGNDELFKELCENWRIEKEITLDNFPECFEKLYIIKRRT